MMFQKKRTTVVYTVSRCDSCGTDNKERFVSGDHVYKRFKCVKCGGKAVICGIFGQEEELHGAGTHEHCSPTA